jgi:hypothetical protein
MVKRIVFSLMVVMSASSAMAWSNHFRLTEIAIDSMTELQSKKVTVTDFSDVVKNQAYLLQDLKTLKNYSEDMEDYDSNLNFNENLKINKGYVFKVDDLGKITTAASVLSQFSDEPDWGMDQLLFRKDQYPSIWKSDYAYMGGSDPNDPVPTQAFRHMYWEAFRINQPSATFKLPTFKSMGQAPARGAIFMALAKRAKELHLDYWSYRFMANALHYLEDVSQPYHSVQTPTKEFWELPFTDKIHGDGLTQFITQVTHIITYYHFNFEDYVALLLEKYEATPSSAPEAIAFVNALKSNTINSQKINPGSKGFYDWIQALSSLAVAQGGQAGRSSIEFFPVLPDSAKFTTFDGVAITKHMDDNYWTQVFKNGETNSPAKLAYFNVVQTMFKALGAYVREAVLTNE